ncbi:histone-lysine N-methyltransferase eggless isoform X2 [Euwallacea fornicatus]|uniref:histone-lysine N-methyltransferase eggless isoform X2 n=1 Tax=Euwallacea fornicatus TaxID=995702 RepID=UPI00338D7719
MDSENVDDPMEIDEPLPVTPIIERRMPLTSPSPAPSEQSRISLSSISAAPSIVILDDDDDDEQQPTSVASETNSIVNNIPKGSPVKSTETVPVLAEPVKEIINLVDKPTNSRCINTGCEGKSSEYIFAPDFCLSSFRVKKSSSNKEEICMICYYKSVEDNDKLATTLKEGKLLSEVDLPLVNETLQIDDSDEEENDTGDVEYIVDENFKFISENIEDILMETIEQLDLKNHVEREWDCLKKKAMKIEENLEELMEKPKTIRSVLDRIQIDLYNQFRPELRQLKGIMILDDYSLSPTLQIRPENIPAHLESSNRRNLRIPAKTNTVTQTQQSQSAALTSAESNRVFAGSLIPKDLPVTLTLDKPEPKLDDIYYIAKDNNPQGCWVKARLQQIIAANTTFRGKTYESTHYRLVELKKQTERIVNGTIIAYFNSCKSRLSVGSRVLSQFRDTNLRKQYPYYAGVVGENPVESNKYRYLIFFDIGYAQYVEHSGINLIFKASKNIWEDMPEDTRPFIRKYLESQDRPMVKLTANQTVRVEYMGKWWLCTVKAVDCSLVQVYFDQINRWEMIYRGSTRLSPMFREELAATTRQTGLRTPRKLSVISNESVAVVQYTRNDDYVQPPPTEAATPPGVARAVARKSTTKPNATTPPAPKCVPFLPPVNNSEGSSTGPTSKIMYFTPRDQQVTKREYKPHECGPSCKSFLTHNFIKLRGHNPLSKPLLCGWARMSFKDRGRKEIVYKAPCGRMIRNISEIHYYLRVTESEMTVDLFDFNHMVRCLAEFSVECQPDPRDLSKGLEQVPIPVINGFNNDMLDFCNYSNKRVPMEGVHLNLDEEFLCGCDCEDDCVDKLKCSCWKLTLGGLKYLGKDIDPISVGYIYKRLQEQVITGIYECNSRCKCSSTCLNRVAQNPMSLKLQVFKTHNRGWGIRCLNDIPQGTFICIYAGTLHTEQTANEDGMQYGDEYFAELDYIETVEKFKEDYEEDVMEDEEFEKEKTPPPAEEPKLQKMPSAKKRNAYMDDNDFTPNRPVFAKPANVEADQGIRSRLRKRKEEDDKKSLKEEKKEENGDSKKTENEAKVKQEPLETRNSMDGIRESMDTVTISDDEDDGREVLSFNPKAKDVDEATSKYLSVRELFGPEESDNIYIMDAKNAGNIGRFLNHSCSPNVFVQNVFVDTHDVRFPWVAFFSSQFIRAGTELTWNYNYDIGSVPGRVLYCHCASLECKGRLL